MPVLTDRKALIAQVESLRRIKGVEFPAKVSAGKEVFLDTAAGKLRSLWYGFEHPAVAPVYFDMHGGGFVMGSADQDEIMNKEIAARSGVKVISVEYYKAPEYPYPVALDQVMEVIGHVRALAASLGIDEDKMAIGGHSAGGNLAAAACMRAKRGGDFQFSCQILDYPPLDLASDPRVKFSGEELSSTNRMAFYNQCYLPHASCAKDPMVSPVYSSPQDLAGLPPALFILPGKDPLCAEGLAYAEMLRRAGVDASTQVYPDSNHGFTKWPSQDTFDAIDRMIAFLSAHLIEQVRSSGHRTE